MSDQQKTGQPKTFGEVVESLMAERYLTMRDLAKAAGVSLDTVRRLRSMKSPHECRPTTFRSLAAGLNLSVEQLHELTKFNGPVAGATAA